MSSPSSSGSITIHCRPRHHSSGSPRPQGQWDSPRPKPATRSCVMCNEKIICKNKFSVLEKGRSFGFILLWIIFGSPLLYLQKSSFLFLQRISALKEPFWLQRRSHCSIRPFHLLSLFWEPFVAPLVKTEPYGSRWEAKRLYFGSILSKRES